MPNRRKASGSLGRMAQLENGQLDIDAKLDTRLRRIEARFGHKQRTLPGKRTNSRLT